MDLSSLSDSILVVVLLLNLLALGTSRIGTVIRVVAIQGLLLGVMPLLVHEHVGVRVVLLSVSMVVLKGFVIPAMLSRAMREAAIKREVEPIIGLLASMLLGALATGLSLAFAAELPLEEGHLGSLFVPASFSTVLVGFILLTTRLKAISQVLGYLVLENGIFIFGLMLLEAMPLLVEFGALLDLFVGIFVISIIIHHLQREFSSLDTRRLATLRE